MALQTMRGGPWDGHVLDVPDHCSTVAFPMARAGGPGGSGRTGRSLAELEPEIRMDYETGAIIAPPDLVMEWVNVHYRRTADGFTYEG